MSDRVKSRGVNKTVLKQDLGLNQLSNTSIFMKDRVFVLSPSMQNAHNWFDLRKINIDRFNENITKGFLLIRFFDKFLLTDLSLFKKHMMPEERFVYTKSIGDHWKFNIIQQGSNYLIVNQQDRTKKYKIEEVSLERLRQLI
ncbi:hypothetical protein [Planococcus sp. CAU13]|uniref:hypothetical protein n=1 Tax=Planococcus sp. CAU13 TaxID=1541197 RepID=UPI00052FFF73|nr:hypothetical protein [Planococcus sp. CAU13]